TAIEVTNKVPTNANDPAATINTTIQGNFFHSAEGVAGVGIEFMNHDSAGPNAPAQLYGNIVVGGSGVANEFSKELSQFIVLNNEVLADSQLSVRPDNFHFGWNSSTVQAPFGANILAANNLFDV